jgi:hypothetical protein
LARGVLSAVVMRFVRDQDSFFWVTPPRELTDGIVREITDALSARLRRGEPYAAIFDLSDAGVPTAVQRQMLATHMRSNGDLIAKWVRALAVVAPSPVVRGVATAIFWIEPPRVPHRVLATPREAETWARGLVAA